ncbi:MAG: hypothetical protein AAB553_06375 [Patescibacteria group bacterium]
MTIERISFLKSPEVRVRQAERKVWRLSGAEAYREQGIDRLISDVGDEIDATTTIPRIAHILGWSQDTADKFFSHQARQPFKSAIQLEHNHEARKEQLATIGSYLKLKYDHATDKTEKKSTARKLRKFSSYALWNLFSQEFYVLEDEINGVTAQGRASGEIAPTPEILTLFKQEAAKKAADEGEADELYQRALQTTDNAHFPFAKNFLDNHRGDKKVRDVLSGVVEQRLSDRELQIKHLQLTWKTHAFLLQMGIDWETYLEIYDFPDPKNLAINLENALESDSAETQNLLAHMQTETPRAREKREQEGKINYAEVQLERAITHRLPEEAESAEQITRKIREVEDHAYSLLPLADVSLETSHVEATASRTGAMRAWNFSYTNTAGLPVNVVNNNPRRSKERFAAAHLHELTHKAHSFLLQQLETNGVYQKGSYHEIAPRIQEEIAELLETQMRIIMGNSSATTHQESPDLEKAIIIRRNIVEALTQQTVAQELERRLKSGQTHLSSEQAGELVDQMQPRISALYKKGTGINHPHETLLTNLDPLDHYNGMAYISSTLTSEALGDAFYERFTRPDWINDNDAYILFLGLLAHSGAHPDKTTTYKEFISTADIQQIQRELEGYGIPTQRETIVWEGI